jgi:hypothetical protein
VNNTRGTEYNVQQASNGSITYVRGMKRGEHFCAIIAIPHLAALREYISVVLLTLSSFFVQM